MDKVELHKHLCEELNQLYEKKNHDYGDSFHQSFVEEGLAMARIRLGDKFSRFKTLSRNDISQKVTDESIRDTLIDLANYALMTVLEMDLVEENRLRKLAEENALNEPNAPSKINCNAPPYKRANRVDYVDYATGRGVSVHGV